MARNLGFHTPAVGKEERGWYAFGAVLKIECFDSGGLTMHLSQEGRRSGQMEWADGVGRRSARRASEC